jgi:hypothetical protein
LLEKERALACSSKFPPLAESFVHDDNGNITDSAVWKMDRKKLAGITETVMDCAQYVKFDF